MCTLALVWFPAERGTPFWQFEVVLVSAGQLADQGEQWQVHGNDDSAHDDAEKNDHGRLQSGEEILHRRVHLFFVEVSDLLQHRIHCARLFAYPDHLCHHAREHIRFLERVRQILTLLQSLANLAESLFDYGIPCRPRRDIQSLEDGHARGNQSAQRAREPGHRNLAQENAYQRQLQERTVEDETALFRSVPELQGNGHGDKDDKNQQPEDAAYKIAQRDNNSRG